MAHISSDIIYQIEQIERDLDYYSKEATSLQNELHDAEVTIEELRSEIDQREQTIESLLTVLETGEKAKTKPYGKISAIDCSYGPFFRTTISLVSDKE
jgi:chromosome segregation ATPase